MTKKSNLEQIHTLANSIRRTYNRLRQITDQIHDDTNLSAPKRTLLLDLQREGPQTVPALAAFRCVSRQITQIQVNELLDAGYVQTVANPAHKRSPLIALSKNGEKIVNAMITKELEFLEKLSWLPKMDAVESCKKVLDSIYDHLNQL